MKKLLVILMCAMFLGIGSNAIAGGFQLGGDECVDGSCNEIKNSNVVNGDGNVGIQGKNNRGNIIVGGDLNKGTNAGGTITNRNVNENTNTNRNVNENTNTNRNNNTNIQGQMQGQLQGQAQGQGQKQKLEFSQKFEDKRDHVNPAPAMVSDTKLQKGNPYDHKTIGTVWGRVDELTAAQAKKLAKDSTDFEIEEAVIWEYEHKIASIQKGSKGEFMGYIYITPTGPDATYAGLQGVAAVRAMELGATHMREYYHDTGNEATGSSWNIGLGGGASILSDGETTAVAPNGGFGFGSASAGNEERSALVFELWHDADSIVKEKKAEVVSGYGKPVKTASSGDCKFTEFDNMADYFECKNNS